MNNIANTLDRNAIADLTTLEIEATNGAGPVGDALHSVSDFAAGFAASSKGKVAAAATAVSFAADLAADYADSQGW